MYEKLGDLLSEALESGKIYSKEQLDMPQEVKTAFERFGISSDFTYQQARKIYHEKLQFYHPDKNVNNDQFQSQKLTESLIKNWNIIADYYESKK